MTQKTRGPKHGNETKEASRRARQVTRHVYSLREFVAVDRAREARWKRNDAKADARPVALVVDRFRDVRTVVKDLAALLGSDRRGLLPIEAAKCLALVDLARNADASAAGAWKALVLSRSVESAEAARVAYEVASEAWRAVARLGEAEDGTDEEFSEDAEDLDDAATEAVEVARRERAEEAARLAVDCERAARTTPRPCLSCDGWGCRKCLASAPTTGSASSASRADAPASGVDD